VTPAAPAAEAAPTEATLGVPIFPGAQFIASYDAGRGQRYYIFGSPAPFVDVVTYYRTVLKQKGELVYDVPATHEFDVGKYREETMAFPPGVTIKDFQSDISQGYPNPKPGGQPARFPTIIQVVPVTEK
jgi:predicted amidohydrolase